MLKIQDSFPWPLLINYVCLCLVLLLVKHSLLLIAFFLYTTLPPYIYIYMDYVQEEEFFMGCRMAEWVSDSLVQYLEWKISSFNTRRVFSFKNGCNIVGFVSKTVPTKLQYEAAAGLVAPSKLLPYPLYELCESLAALLTFPFLFTVQTNLEPSSN